MPEMQPELINKLQTINTPTDKQIDLAAVKTPSSKHFIKPAIVHAHNTLYKSSCTVNSENVAINQKLPHASIKMVL